MALRTDLMGLGMAAAPASLLGDEANTAITAVGTLQAGAASLVLGMNTLTTSAGQTAVIIPSTMPVGDDLFVINSTSTTALLFPPTSGTINGGSANASVNVAQNKPTYVKRLSSTAFAALIGA